MDNFRDAKIQFLPSEVATQIAAGEVIERPAAMIQELIENAVDAGAKRISVNVEILNESNSIGRIIVSDDGCGRSAEEIPIAFERHATSKLRILKDLETVQSYGFRGEALPSIAAVADVNCLSRTVNQTLGTRIRIRNGTITHVEKMGAPLGTRIEADHLFARQPARKKFQASGRSERTAISQICSSAALAQPSISFTLAISGKRQFSSPGRPESKSVNQHSEFHAAFTSVWGSKIADDAVWFHELLNIPTLEEVPIEFWGLAANPTQNRSRRNGIQLFINGRPIKSTRLSFAVERSYAEMLPNRRYPIAAVFLKIPGERIDVNVHPSKAIVKLQDEHLIFGLVESRMRIALLRNNQIRSYRPQTGKPDKNLDFLNINRNIINPSGMEKPRVTGSEPQQRYVNFRAPSTLIKSSRNTENLRTDNSFGEEMLSKLPILRPIGQTHNLFVVTEGPQGIILVDQHAAHERVIYEQLLVRRNEPMAKQVLLSPAVIELTPEQQIVLSENLSSFSALGYSLEPFGDQLLRVQAVPSATQWKDPNDSFLKILDDLSDQQRVPNKNDPVAASSACHASVRAGQTLDMNEIRTLLRDLENCQNPHNCPHGRPTMIEISINDLFREFGRT